MILKTKSPAKADDTAVFEAGLLAQYGGGAIKEQNSTNMTESDTMSQVSKHGPRSLYNLLVSHFALFLGAALPVGFDLRDFGLP